jgi:arylsulfatase A-like enzyme
MLRVLAVVAAWLAAAWWSSIHRDRATEPEPPGPRRGENHPADTAALRAALSGLPAVGNDRPDIAVVVLDTVRRDRLGIYGSTAGTSPNLDAWAERSRVYDFARSDGNWTLPAHASLFTGLVVATHGAHSGPRGTRAVARGLKPGTPTVAGALRAAGYRTIGIAANRAFLQRGFGLDAGFDAWLCSQLDPDASGLQYTSGARVAALAKEAAADAARESLFLFVNLMDAHGPYRARAESVRGTVDRHVLPYRAGFAAAKFNLLSRGSLPEAVQDSWSRAYDAGLRDLDAVLGELLPALDGFSRVFVLSDHGEFLGEHGLVEHGKDVYSEVVDIVLVVRGEPIDRDPSPVQTHDVARMVLDAAGVSHLPGMEVPDELQVSESYWTHPREFKERYGHRFDRVRRNFLHAGHQWIVGSDGTQEFYDLARGPQERERIHAPPWAGELRAMAEAWIEAHPAREWEEGDLAGAGAQPDLAPLRALGYVDEP